MEEDTECPICTEQLKLVGGGELLKAYAIPADAPSTFGNDIVSLECGHRLHRFCLVRWLQSSQLPSCPSCRSLTQWVPTIDEQRQLVPLVQQGWKVLAVRERGVIKFVWALAGLACLTDPLVLVFLSFFMVVILPPIFFPAIFVMLSAARKLMQGVEPGGRMFYALGIATAITLACVLHNAAVNENIEPT